MTWTEVGIFGRENKYILWWKLLSNQVQPEKLLFSQAELDDMMDELC